jgi:hypothetical protein
LCLINEQKERLGIKGRGGGKEGKERGPGKKKRGGEYGFDS